LRKIIDEIDSVRCAAGPGVIREEVWEDESGAVARYNLAFINHFMTAVDHGRVLGYDNAHGEHERHFYGTVAQSDYVNYEALLARFQDEVAELKKEKA
jgi:hypothetical protein